MKDKFRPERGEFVPPVETLSAMELVLRGETVPRSKIPEVMRPVADEFANIGLFRKHGQGETTVFSRGDLSAPWKSTPPPRNGGEQK